MPAFYKGYKKHIKIHQISEPMTIDTPEIKGGSLMDRLSKISFKPSKSKLLKQIQPTGGRLVNPNQDIIRTTDPKKVINPKLQKFIHLKL